MKCYKCGKEINDGARFCTFCGTEQPIESQAEETVSDKRGKTGVIIALCIIAVVLVATAIIMAVKFTGNSSTPDSKEEQSAETENVTEEVQEVQQEPLYTSMEIPTINLNVQNHEPGQKAEGMQWDSSLFYWLEDIDKESEDDGHIYDCVVEKTLRWYEDDNCFIEYNVYRNPDNREIYKIVSIVRYDNELTLTDYYYQASKPNFIFWRTDSIYTPTYASPEKTGQRFYFNNDAMVRWRTIETPNEIGEYVLAKRDVNYAQLNYYEQTPEIQAIYDDTERKLLNQAYNIYDSVANSDCVGILESSIHGTDGSALADMTVEVYSAQDGTLLYRTKTDETGKFSIGVKLDDTECYVTVAGNDIYEPNQVYGIRLNTVYPMSSYNNLVMHKKSGDEYQVSLNVYDATAVTMQEDGEGNRSTVLPQGIGNAAVTVRSGSAARTGEVLQSLTTDANGQITMTLPSGNYTLQIDASGYQPLYYTVEVDEESVTRNCFAVPVSIERKKIIVMTWDNPDYDLDLTIFTPYQGTNGDMAYIGGSTLSDNYGNTIISDNNAYCEVAYVDDSTYGDYKIYVNNYTDSKAGNYSSDVLSNINAHIYIYDANGFFAEYMAPTQMMGVVWEVVEMDGYNYIPCQRIYSELEGKNWWINGKNAEVYLQKSEELLQEGNCVEALMTIQEGIKQTNSEILVEYEEYVKEHVVSLPVVFGKREYQYEYGYDESGAWINKTFIDNELGRTIKDEIRYDGEGNQIRQLIYSPDSDIYYCFEDKYDYQGNHVEYISYDEEGNSISRCQFKYNDRGDLIGEYTVGNNEYNHEYEYTYDDKNNIIFKEYYEEGSKIQSEEMKYDSQNNEIEKLYYNSNDELFKTEQREYDSNGNIIKYIRRNDYIYNNLMNYYSEWQYDWDNNIEKCETKSQYGPESNSETYYDSKHNVLKYVLYGNKGQILDSEETEYDEYGNKVKSIKLYQGKYRNYTYDVFENVISQDETKYEYMYIYLPFTLNGYTRVAY